MEPHPETPETRTDNTVETQFETPPKRESQNDTEEGHFFADDESRQQTTKTTRVTPTLSQLQIQQVSPKRKLSLVQFSSHKVEKQTRVEDISLDANIHVFLNNKNRYDIEKLFQAFVEQFNPCTTERYFWKKIPKLSKRFLHKIENNKIFDFSDFHHLKVRDFFTAFLYLKRQDLTLSLVCAPNNFLPPWLFSTFVATKDPFYALNTCVANTLWEHRKVTVRDKLGARTIFENNTENFDRKFDNIQSQSITLDKWPEQVKQLYEPWLSSWCLKTPKYTITDKKQAATAYFIRHRNEGPRQKSTQSWQRAKGADDVLINPLVGRYYKFKNGNDLFPLNYVPGKSIDFLQRSSISDGLTLNPPYSTALLTKIIVKLVKLATELRRVYAVLVPVEKHEEWFQLCVEMSYPILQFTENLAFQRGTALTYRGLAPFESCWILIGVESKQTFFNISTNFLGFPTSWEYVRHFEQMIFPQNVTAAYPIIPGRGIKIRLGILRAFYKIAEFHNSTHTPPSVNSQFEFGEIKKFNHLLQNVEHEGIDLISIGLSYKLNSFLKQKGAWEKYQNKRRVIFTYPSLKKYLDGFFTKPADKFLHKQCNLCKRLNHVKAFCPQRCPKSTELGLKDNLEKKLYAYLATLDYERHSLSNKNMWDTLHIFESLLEKWLSIEAQFWENFRLFLEKREIFDFSPLLKDVEFSKGRKALGFNYATGAQRAELVLDAFGALLDLVQPPDPCEFVQAINNNVITYPEISPEMSQEDTINLKRRTSYIVPKQYIKWILPRFSVVNTDRTTRTINDCTPLGPFTIKNGFRLPGKNSLRSLSEGDLVMSMDGKSAYKQRKLCWADRNKIGFRTKISNRECYITVVTLPFGLHNAGYIYQMSLYRKLKRIAGRLFFLEYIDDVTVKIGHIRDTVPTMQWKASAFLFLTTKIGEIFNNKFDIFSNRVTMLGVHYYPITDRFTPKLSTFYKLGTKFAKILTKGSFSLSQLESVIGSCLWLLPENQRHLLQPFQFSLKYAQKQLQQRNVLRRYKRKKPLTEKTTCHNVTALFLDTVFLTVAEVMKQYLLIDTPSIEKVGSTLFIAVDSNPLVAGGYLFYRGQTSGFRGLKSLDIFREEISQLGEQFIQDHSLEKIFHSFRSEGVGLLAFLKISKKAIKQILPTVDSICILLDNQGLVTKLEKANAQETVAFATHQRIFELLKTFDKPFCFRWLSRESPQLKLADSIGRDDFSVNTVIYASTEKLINKFFKTITDRPLIFNLYKDFTFLMPPVAFKLQRPEGTTPLMVFSPTVKIQTLVRGLTCLSQLDHDIIVGFPILRNNLPEIFAISNIDRLTFTSWTEVFAARDRTTYRPSNSKYIFTKLKRGVDIQNLNLPF